MYALGGTPYNSQPMATLDECKEPCEESALCVALDYSTARTPYCWHHLDVANLESTNMRPLVANDHYRFNNACAPRRQCHDLSYNSRLLLPRLHPKLI